MKKLLIIFPFLPKYDVEFLRLLSHKEKNLEIHVAASINKDNQLNLREYSNEPFTVHNIESFSLGPFIYTKGISKLKKNVSPNVTIYTGNPRDLATTLSVIFSRIFGQISIVWSMFHRIGGPILYSELYYHFIGRLASRNFCYSEKGYAIHVDRLGSAAKVGIIGTAIDERIVLESKTKITDQMLQSIKKKYSLNDKKILLQVVRLTEIKKPFYLIDMVKKLKDRTKSFKLVLIGGGPLEDEVKKRADEMNVLEDILFLGPIYNEEELGIWFSLADLFVMPTCIGLSAHHAFCYKLPIVTDDSVHNQASEFSILEDGLNCKLYQENKISDFVEKIIYLLNNDKVCKALGQNGYETIINKHNLANKVDNFRKQLNKCISFI